MKASATNRVGSCEVVEAEFVFGPKRCGLSTHLVTVDDGEEFFVCPEHVVAAREATS